MYKKIKKQNGEKFAQTLRNHHDGLLELPDLDILLRHAGRDATPLLPYLTSLLDNTEEQTTPTQDDPFALLAQAGYDAFHADSLVRQNSIKRFFAPGELLCTFNDAARHEKYHIVHAVRKDVDSIRRADFKGREQRQDDYGTSVISIQMRKTGGFISIKNRYNHTVTACDNTFGSNPDNIIPGLSAALQKHFNVEFNASGSSLPEGFVPLGKHIFKYNQEYNNIYYGDQAWVEDGIVQAVDKGAGDALFDSYLFDNKTKTLKKIDSTSADSFADDFNRCYGGNRGLSVRNGNLTLDGTVLIGAEESRIKTLYLPGLTTMGDSCLRDVPFLTHFDAPSLVEMGGVCLEKARFLTHFDAPSLVRMGDFCLKEALSLTHFDAPSLVEMASFCLEKARSLTHFNAPSLVKMASFCLEEAWSLTHFDAPALVKMGEACLKESPLLTRMQVRLQTSPSKGGRLLSNAFKNCAEGIRTLTNKIFVPAATESRLPPSSRNL